MPQLVERTRLVERPSVAGVRPNPGTGQHWTILLFESVSAGAIAVGVGLAAVLIVVGLYVLIVWPLTFWDLADAGLEKYSDLAQVVIWSVFGGGTLAGYWCFSGEAFKPKVRKKIPVRRARR